MSHHIDPATYLKTRVDDQIAWHDRKSTWNQKRYKRFRILVLIFSVLIPFAAGYLSTFEWLSYVVGALGVLVAIFEGLLALNKYHENWTQYRLITERLQREKLKYQTQTGSYKDPERAFGLLVERTEQILSEETKHWSERIQEDGSNA